MLNIEYEESRDVSGLRKTLVCLLLSDGSEPAAECGAFGHMRHVGCQSYFFLIHAIRTVGSRISRAYIHPHPAFPGIYENP